MSLVLTHTLLPTSNGSSRAYYPPQCQSLLPYPKVGDVLCTIKCYIVTHESVHVRSGGSAPHEILGVVGSGGGGPSRLRDGGDYFSPSSAAGVQSEVGQVNNLVALQVDSLSPGAEAPHPQLKRCLEDLLIRPLSGILFPYLYIGGAGGAGGSSNSNSTAVGGVRPGYYWKVDISLQVSSSAPSSSVPSSLSGDYLTVSPSSSSSFDGPSSLPSPQLFGVDAGLFTLCNAALLAALKTCIIPLVSFPTVTSVFEPSSKTATFVPAELQQQQQGSQQQLPLLSFLGDINLASPLLPGTFPFMSLPVVLCLPVQEGSSSLFVSVSLEEGGGSGRSDGSGGGKGVAVHGFHLSVAKGGGSGGGGDSSGFLPFASVGDVIGLLATLPERLKGGTEKRREVEELLQCVRDAKKDQGSADF